MPGAVSVTGDVRHGEETYKTRESAEDSSYDRTFQGYYRRFSKV